MTQQVAEKRKYKERNCGTRTRGSAYAATTLGRDYPDLPIEQWLFCPPHPVDIKDLGLSDQGLVILERPNGSGIWDMWDVVGSSMYTPADFFEEGKRLEFSRKVPNTVLKSDAFKNLTNESSHFIIHKFASYQDPVPFYKQRATFTDPTWQLPDCPQGHAHHNDTHGGDIYEMCTALLWQNDYLTKKAKNIPEVHEVQMPRKAEDIDYVYEAAFAPPINIRYDYAVFMQLPICQLEIIRDPVDDLHHIAMSLLYESGSSIPYVLEDE